MMATPSSPILRAKSRSLTPDAAVNISSKLRRNSLVSDHEDMVLLREKLTRIAVGRHRRQFDAAPGAAQAAIDEEEREEEEERELRRRRSSGAAHEHFKVFPLLPPERPSTPPSSPQPRDVLRKQLWLKQQVAKTRRGGGGRDDEEEERHDAGLDAMMSVDEVEITPWRTWRRTMPSTRPSRTQEPAGETFHTWPLESHAVLQCPQQVSGRTEETQICPCGRRRRRRGRRPRVSLKKTSVRSTSWPPPAANCPAAAVPVETCSRNLQPGRGASRTRRWRTAARPSRRHRRTRCSAINTDDYRRVPEGRGTPYRL